VLVKKSRYRNARKFSADASGDRVFDGLRSREIGKTTAILEHEIQAGDRLDNLARHYYNDDRLWWRIVDANAEITFAENILGENMVGQVLLIPAVSE